MDENNIHLKNNPFETRGCCHPPKVYQKNEDLYSHRCCKFDSFDWLKSIELPEGHPRCEFIEVRFKNSRKDFFRMTDESDFEVGDIVAVEANPGHDIGIVNLVGEVVRLQMKSKGVKPTSEEVHKVYRRARLSDIEKWITAVGAENTTMYKARSIADRLNLGMKINDVEYQGDSTKAVFYYTADERVDFRELIKILAEEFKVRIEMRQIGVRQEASRLGGLGSCGRELCCTTWLNEFKSVTTNAARVQQLSLNPQKLAGQCSKLKCCLNYEYPAYVEAQKDFPNPDILLKSKKGEAFHQKTDVFQRMMWYSYVSEPSNMLAIPVDSVKEIMESNKQGKYPENLDEFAHQTEKKVDFNSVVGLDDLTRFDHL